ncbi:large ribosomal subunit protein mL50 [Culicoides brevitarsis]|uniref:large ribosomal subunit protein mL50 n=1 Tax=Culicoides brevitarsis TaxID=469753 RepID=UPI00307BE953
MAGILRHVSKTLLKQQFTAQNVSVRFASPNRIKPFRVNKPKAPEKGASIESFGTKLESKGYLRPHKPYDPPSDASSKVQAIAQELNVTEKLGSPKEKFEFLNKCFLAFNHIVPNSRLHEIQTVDDVVKFYETPVSKTVPLDALKTMDLPENLHVQYEYHRFHPDTDTMFNGQTAFPKSHTIVTGLKYKKKYRQYEAKMSWP